MRKHGRFARALAFPATLVLAVLLGSSARADEARPNDGDPSRWYGWEALLIDGGAILVGGVDAAVITRVASGDPSISSAGEILLISPALLATGAYLYGGPIIHWARGRTGVGFVSLALRVAAPLVGLGGAAFASQLSPKSSEEALVGVGLGLGAATAIALDDALLAREPPRPDAPRPQGFLSLLPWTISITPTLDRAHNGVGLRVRGAF